MARTLIEEIACTLQALANCRESGNKEWSVKHGEALAKLEEMLPHGSGFDSGTRVNHARTAISLDKVTFHTAFHHMNEQGGYDGWTEHDVVVTPSFIGQIDIRVTGRDRNGIKDHIDETFHQYLLEELE